MSAGQTKQPPEDFVIALRRRDKQAAAPQTHNSLFTIQNSLFPSSLPGRRFRKQGLAQFLGKEVVGQRGRRAPRVLDDGMHSSQRFSGRGWTAWRKCAGNNSKLTRWRALCLVADRCETTDLRAGRPSTPVAALECLARQRPGGVSVAAHYACATSAFERTAGWKPLRLPWRCKSPPPSASASIFFILKRLAKLL